MYRPVVCLTALLLTLSPCVQAKAKLHKHHHSSHITRKTQHTHRIGEDVASPEEQADAAQAARQDRYDESHPGARAARAEKIHEDYLREQEQRRRR